MAGQARLLGKDPAAAEAAILANWDALLPAKLVEWAVDVEHMKRFFEAYRSDWMINDERSWLAANSLYHGIAEALRSCQVK